VKFVEKGVIFIEKGMLFNEKRMIFIEKGMTFTAAHGEGEGKGCRGWGGGMPLLWA